MADMAWQAFYASFQAVWGGLISELDLDDGVRSRIPIAIGAEHHNNKKRRTGCPAFKMYILQLLVHRFFNNTLGGMYVARSAVFTHRNVC